MQNPMSTVIEQRIFTNRVKNLDNLVCSKCGSINIQMQSVLVYPRKEDQETQQTIEVNIASGKLAKGKQVGHQSMANNVLSFICHCSHCDGFSRFDVIQHRDEGYIKIYPVDNDKFNDVKY